ncbi:MAG: hypothetical protein HZB67_00175 [Candidatus Aenigmarchaeota archaeon]|nr:hypothetical protein [Candidatus Aenigmarchaeota archaeon]
MRLTEKEKREILELTRKGISLNKISSTTEIRKTTIYYHVRKQFGRHYKLVEVGNNLEHIGEFLGMFAADGSYQETDHGHVIRIWFSLDELKYLRATKRLLMTIFKKRPNVYRSKNNAYEIRYTSMILGSLLKEYLIWEGKKSHSVRLKSMKHSSDFLIGFVRGFLDCDGYVNKKSKIVSIFSISQKMMKQIFTIISSFGFKPQFYTYIDKRGNRKPLHFVNIRGDQSVEFLNLIKPRNKKRIRKWVHPDSKSPNASIEAFSGV